MAYSSRLEMVTQWGVAGWQWTVLEQERQERLHQRDDIWAELKLVGYSTYKRWDWNKQVFIKQMGEAILIRKNFVKEATKKYEKATHVQVLTAGQHGQRVVCELGHDGRLSRVSGT